MILESPIEVMHMHRLLGQSTRAKPSVGKMLSTMMTRCSWNCSDEVTCMLNNISRVLIGPGTWTYENKLYIRLIRTQHELLFTTSLIKSIMISMKVY